MLSAGNFTKPQAEDVCDGLEQCGGFFGAHQPTPGSTQWFVFVHGPQWEETVFPGMDSFVKEYPIWSCQNDVAMCVVSTNKSTISAATSAASKLSCETDCISERWTCRDGCRMVNRTRLTQLQLSQTYHSIEECQIETNCSSSGWTGEWTVTSGGEYCALLTDDAGNLCVQDTSGDYGDGEDLWFRFCRCRETGQNGVAAVITRLLRLRLPPSPCSTGNTKVLWYRIIHRCVPALLASDRDHDIRVPLWWNGNGG